MNAAAAGVFVAAAVGNDGSRDAINNAGPWVATVGATTVRPRNDPAARLGDGRVLRGVSRIREPLGRTPAVLADRVPAAGVDAAQAARCANGSLDPEKVRGRVVVCDRTGSSSEQVTLPALAPGTYTAQVNGFGGRPEGEPIGA